ncbi:MAG: PqqD family protein [Clostridia bacterium]|nr:PqqD family protein [Clostridia bacterium]
MSDRIYKIKPKYILREIAGEYLAIPLEGADDSATSQIIILNEVSSFFWERLQQGATEAQLVSDLTAEFEVTREEAQADLQEFLTMLEESGFFE